jgi:Ca2+-binding EF-hand superfamily protein
MFNDIIYRFCSPGQLAIAKKANIVNFISNHKNISDSLIKLAKETFQFFSINMGGSFDLRDLSAAMSYIFKNSAPQDLMNKFTEHVLQEQNVHNVSECLNALGPLIVGIAFKTSDEKNV